MNNEKYPALSLISYLYKIFGWITLLVGIACIAWAIFGSSAYALILAVSAFFAALISFALAELIIVLVDIEFNTRNKNSSPQTHLEIDAEQVETLDESTFELADKDLLNAVKGGDSAAVSQLLKQGKTATAMDENKKTLLQIALENKDSTMIQLLKAYGAK
jgi:hypothetical protein